MKETEQIRKAEKKDIDAVAAIYAHIHEQERTGKATIGWLPGIYPVRGTAEAALVRENGCTVLRMDTNAKNAAARRLSTSCFSSWRAFTDFSSFTASSTFGSPVSSACIS